MDHIPPSYAALVKDAKAQFAQAGSVEELFGRRDEIYRVAVTAFAVPVLTVCGDLDETVRTLWRQLSRRRPAAFGAARAHAWELLFRDRWRSKAAQLRQRRCFSAAARPTPGTQAMTTVVVLSYRRPQVLTRTLRSLCATTDPKRTEIIVVDNGTTPATQGPLKQALAAGAISGLVLSEANLGVSAGYNLGFALASRSSEYFTKIDHDQVLLTPGWLADVTTFLGRHPEVGILGIDQVNHPALQCLPIQLIDGRPVKSWLEWACGTTMTVPRSVRDETLGDFRETTTNYFPDDVDYYMRAQLAGLTGFYLVDHCSYHILKFFQKRDELDQRLTWDAIEKNLSGDYMTGNVPVLIKYPHYRSLSFPRHQRLLVLPARG